MLRAGIATATLALALIAGEAKAAFVGSFGFNGLQTNTNSGDLQTATVFRNSLFSTNNSGIGGFSAFASLPLTQPAYFSPTTGSVIAFNTTSATGFSFTNATYGTFTQTAIAVLRSQAFSSTVPSFVTSVTYYIVGSYSGGSVGAATPASVTITLTQNGGPGQSFSASGTLDIPPASVPEPASLALMGLGLAGVVIARRRMAA